MRPERRPTDAEIAATVATAKERSQQPLFFKTVTASSLRGPEGTGLLREVSDGQALRVVHRGHQIKVLITEERYLSLLNFWNLFEHQEPLPVTTTAEELAAAEREDEELDALEATDRD